MTLFPELAREWNAEKNRTLSPPSEISPWSHRKAHWKCIKGHEWEAVIKSRAQGCGCPVCAGRKVLPGFNDLATTHPRLAEEWDAERNGGLTPDRLAAQSNRKAWWICPLGHSYSATVSSRVNRGSGCPYCAGRRVLPGFNDLATKEPKVAAQWYQPLNGGLTPEQVTCGSSKKAFWRCSEGHVWRAVISSRTGKQKCGCPVCAGRTKVNFAARYQAIMDQERSSYHRPRSESVAATK